MGNKKTIREKGKISFSKYFQKLKKGDNAAVTIEKSKEKNFPTSIQGRTGVIASRRGKFYVVKINDKRRQKEYLIHPIHLKKIKISK